MALPLATAWWAPLAIIGGALVGAVFGYVLLMAVGGGRSREPSGPAPLRFVRTDKTNYPTWNPAAFLAAGAIVAVIVGLSVGLSVS